MSAWAIPLPPVTHRQAVEFVRWCETEIGGGFHPDTAGAEYVTHNAVSHEAKCLRCGETFIPHSSRPEDLEHFITEDGDECGGTGDLAGSWGTTSPMFTEDEARRFDAALAAATEILPDIYKTSMEIFKELHPELLR